MSLRKPTIQRLGILFAAVTPICRDIAAAGDSCLKETVNWNGLNRHEEVCLRGMGVIFDEVGLSTPLS